MAEEQPQPNNQPAPPTPPGNNPNDIIGVDDNKVYAAMSYLTVLVLIPLFSKKDDPFINFHIRQGLVILAGLIIAVIASVWITIIGNLLALILLILNIIALIQALQGNQWRAPVIGKIADSFKI